MGGVEQIIGNVIYIYRFLIIGYVLLSWLPNARESFIGVFIGKLVEPYLSVFRKIIPPLGFIDLSPIIALFSLFLVEQGLVAVVQFLYNIF